MSVLCWITLACPGSRLKPKPKLKPELEFKLKFKLKHTCAWRLMQMLYV